MARRKKTDRESGVIGYTRVSTEEQKVSNLGLEDQRRKITAECQRRGLVLLDIKSDPGVSGKSLDRPALTEALAELDAGRGSVLMVSKLDRLSRNTRDALSLIDQARRIGWDVVALDTNIDTTTATGKLMTTMAAAFAEFERMIIGERTASALAVKKSQGMQLGRPDRVPDAVARRITQLRSEGQSYRAIAAALNDGKVPTAQGGKQWHPGTIRKVCLRNESN